jgi:putative membrane protein
MRGWSELRRVMPSRFTPSRLACFLSGIAALEIALASPIDTFDPFLLTDHMIQHMFLMVIVPPLVLLGDPLIPLLRGLPRSIARDVLGPFLSWPSLGRLGVLLIDPPVALLLLSLAMVGWHLPAAYELALRSPGWHEVEHACFLVASLLFWWPVIQPWPSRPHWPAWAMPVYLLLGDFVNSVISAFLAFSERVLYPSYLAVPRLGGISAQNDQVAAGAVMWAIGSFAFLIPAAIITAKLLSPKPSAAESRRGPARTSSRLGRSFLPALMLTLPLSALADAWLAPDRVDLDGDVVRLQGASGPFQVSVFGEPGSLAAGPTDLAVLVQDRNSGGVILGADIDLAVQSAGGRPTTIVRATRAESTNKLVEAATVDVPAAGPWNLRVFVRQGSSQGALATTLDVAPPAAENSFNWGYLVALGVGASVFILHRMLRSKPLDRGANLPHAS